VFIKPHCLWQNGKAERYNRTLQVEWAYRAVFNTNDARCTAFTPWLEHYNINGATQAIGRKPPISRLSPT
jgi:transposase InsO family protein